VPSPGGVEAADEGEQEGREADVLPFSTDDIKTLMDIVDAMLDVHRAVTALNLSEEECSKNIVQVSQRALI